MNTNRIKCLIVEDEPLAQKILSEHIEMIVTLDLVGTAFNAVEARNLIEKTKPDFIFLDINLPGKNGYDFLKSLPIPRPLVVVTSAHVEFALKGYELEVIDFLQKPIFFDKFESAVSKVENRLRLMHALAGQEATEKVLWAENDKKLVLIRTSYELFRVPFEDIFYIESWDNYVKVNRRSAPTKPLTPRTTLTSIGNNLPSPFLRIHRQFMVNTDYVQKLNASSVLLTNGKELPVSKSCVEQVKLALS